MLLIVTIKNKLIQTSLLNINPRTGGGPGHLSTDGGGGG